VQCCDQCRFNCIEVVSTEELVSTCTNCVPNRVKYKVITSDVVVKSSLYASVFVELHSNVSVWSVLCACCSEIT